MKYYSSLLLCVFACFLASCNNDSAVQNSAVQDYADLKHDTGLSDAELRKSIKYHSNIQELIEGGLLSKEDILKQFESSKDAMASVERDDESAAIWTLTYLRALENEGVDKSAKYMADHLVRFTEAKFPDTESSKRIRESILDYAKTSKRLDVLR